MPETRNASTHALRQGAGRGKARERSPAHSSAPIPPPAPTTTNIDNNIIYYNNNNKPRPRHASDGIFMSVLTSDIIIAKMAGRELHPLVALLALASTLAPSVALACAALYYAATFWDLCAGLNLPLLRWVFE